MKRQMSLWMDCDAYDHAQSTAKMRGVPLSQYVRLCLDFYRRYDSNFKAIVEKKSREIKMEIMRKYLEDWRQDA